LFQDKATLIGNKPPLVSFLMFIPFRINTLRHNLFRMTQFIFGPKHFKTILKQNNLSMAHLDKYYVPNLFYFLSNPFYFTPNLFCAKANLFYFLSNPFYFTPNLFCAKANLFYFLSNPFYFTPNLFCAKANLFYFLSNPFYFTPNLFFRRACFYIAHHNQSINN